MTAVAHTIAIVGANLAGGRAAQALRAHGYEGGIRLIGAESHPPYERPMLSKEVLLRQCEPERSFLMSEAGWEELGVDLHLGSPVTGLRAGDAELELASGERLSADKVLLATGGRVRTLEVPGAHLDGVAYLRTIEDSLRIREQLRPGAGVVVIGGGFIGAEVAASARAAGCEVTLLENGPTPLARILGSEIGAALARVHREEGVTVLTETSVASIEGGSKVTHVITTTGQRIDAALVVVGIGIIPAVELAEQAGLAVDNGVVVDEYCRTSNPAIFAAGDVTNHPNHILGERVRLEQWQNAQNQGAAAARAMIGKKDPFREVPWFWSDQYDISVQMAGLPGGCDDIVYRGDLDSRSFSAFFLRDGVLRATVGVNRPRDVKRTTPHIAAGARVDVAQLQDESTDLRSVAV